jgi:2'-5' RNA ligase
VHGIVSLLDPMHDGKVKALWSSLENECGLIGIKITPIPHFSWHVAEDYNLTRLVPILQGLSEATIPFTVRTTGIAVFTGSRPVIYIPVVRDANLTVLHQQIWQRAGEASSHPSPFYAPQSWLPHITLAHGDVDRQASLCALEKLAGRDFSWEIQIDNFALVMQQDDAVGKLDQVFKFNGVVDTGRG